MTDLPVNAAADMSLMTLLTGASLPVQLVMAILLLVSLVSWWYIFIKVMTISRAEKEAEDFENTFWMGGDLNKLYEGITAGRNKPHGMSSIFEAGFKEFARLKRQQGLEVSDVMEGSRRAMRATFNREMDDLDSHLPYLASVGSVSPYIGLFGTVWGIMNSFMNLSNVHQTTLATVAPGIAEALIATAMGLFAAIPAVLAYNKFSARSSALLSNYQTFAEEFSTILHRQVHSK